MPVHRYTITPLGAFATPLRSDTLYGHLLWAAALTDGAAQAEALIGAFEQGKPPFLLSSAFPKGMLPMPVLPAIPRSDFRQLAAKRPEFKGELAAALEAYKRFRKVAFVPTALICDGAELSQRRLFSRWLDDPGIFKLPEHPQQVFRRQELEPHNSIQRQGGTVLQQGGFYLSEATWYGKGASLDLYVATDDRELFERYLGYVADTGFGADRSTGKGYFAFRHDPAFDPAPFAGVGNGSLSLSVSSNSDLSGFSGTYDVFAKFGKAWSGFGERNPFKSPFVAFAEGAVFSRMPAAGYVLRSIHPNPAIVQVVQPLTLPVKLEA